MTTILQKYGLGQVTPHKVTGLTSIETPHIVKSNELIGIEVEIENVNNLREQPNKVWSIINDGSLRNGGHEFVSRPIEAFNAPKALTYLLHNYLGKECCFSPRTSVHVHLNVQDFTLAQVVDMTLLYTVFERLFYRFTGRGRMKNIYCVPLVDTQLLLGLAEKNLSDTDWSKYTGFNLLPLFSYGTVEFRHMHGTSDIGKLSVWINFITKLKEYVRSSSTKAIRSDIANMDENYPYHELLDNIFGEFAHHLKINSLEELCYKEAKLALTSSRNIANLRASSLKTSDFYTFKEQ